MTRVDLLRYPSIYATFSRQREDARIGLRTEFEKSVIKKYFKPIEPFSRRSDSVIAEIGNRVFKR